MSKEDQYKNDSKTFIVVDELKEILNATYNQAIDDAIVVVRKSFTDEYGHDQYGFPSIKEQLQSLKK